MTTHECETPMGIKVFSCLTFISELVTCECHHPLRNPIHFNCAKMNSMMNAVGLGYSEVKMKPYLKVYCYGLID